MDWNCEWYNYLWVFCSGAMSCQQQLKGNSYVHLNWGWVSTFKSSDFVNESTGRTFFIARRQSVTNSMAITSFPAACSLRNWKVFNFNLIAPSISANNHSFFNLISRFLKYPWQWNQRNLSVAGIPLTISRQNAMLCAGNPKWKI